MPTPGATAGPRGVLVSVGSSILFAAIYFTTPLLAPLGAEPLWAVRAVVTVLFVTAVLAATGGWSLVTTIATRIAHTPLLLLGIILSGALLAVQLWLFGWAPLNGRGLPVALGYFLLPLVLVLVGRFLYGERMRWWQWAAAAVAAIGVGFEIIRVGSIGWETLVVALGYPLYFVLRRRLGTAHLGGMWWEFAVALPLALTLLAAEFVSGSAFATRPELLWLAPLFGLLAAAALMLYLLASRLLPLGLFGLLSYVEPALLVVAAVLIGERITAAELPGYLAIWAAVGILLIGGSVELLRARRRR